MISFLKLRLGSLNSLIVTLVFLSPTIQAIASPCSAIFSPQYLMLREIFYPVDGNFFVTSPIQEPGFRSVPVVRPKDQANGIHLMVRSITPSPEIEMPPAETVSVPSHRYSRNSERESFKPFPQTTAHRRQILKEWATFYGQLKSQNFPRVLKAHTSGEKPFLILEWPHDSNFKSLRDRIEDAGPQNPIEPDWLIEVALAIKKLHELPRPLFHGNLKPENIWIDAPAESSAKSRILILTPSAPMKNSKGVITSFTTSPIYNPYLLAGPRADWVSLGIILAETVTGSRPTPNTSRQELIRLMPPELPRKEKLAQIIDEAIHDPKYSLDLFIHELSTWQTP